MDFESVIHDQHTVLSETMVTEHVAMVTKLFLFFLVNVVRFKKRE